MEKKNDEGPNSNLYDIKDVDELCNIINGDKRKKKAKQIRDADQKDVRNT